MIERGEMMETYQDFINNILETRGRFNCGDEYHEKTSYNTEMYGWNRR